MKKKRTKKTAMKPVVCPRCGIELFWSADIQLLHCFKCGGWFAAGRLKNV